MVTMKKTNVSKCKCGIDTGQFANAAGFTVGIVGNIILGLIAITALIMYIFNIEKSWIILTFLWLGINAIDFVVSFIVRKFKKHTFSCSLRYAFLNIFYSGVIF